MFLYVGNTKKRKKVVKKEAQIRLFWNSKKIDVKNTSKILNLL